MDADMMTIMRMAERLIGVLIGGMCVFLGYRLFMALPDKTDSAGKIILPGGIDIKLSRIGPGVFFALFGISVVISSHYNAVKTESYESAGAATKVRIMHAASPALGESALEQDRKLVEARAQLVVLDNELPGYLKPGLPESGQERIGQAIGYAKRQILQNVWRPEWGQFNDFERWLNQGSPQPVPESLQEPAALYNPGKAGAP